MADKIVDPVKYLELCEPFASIKEANAAVEAFWADFYALRCKYEIPDAHATLRLMVLKDDGKTAELFTSMHAGSSDKEESMAAFALGEASGRREARLRSYGAAGAQQAADNARPADEGGK